MAARAHRNLLPLRFVVGPDEQSRAELVVAIGQDVGADREPVALDPLGRVPAPVELGFDPLDDDRPSGADAVGVEIGGRGQAAQARSGGRHRPLNPTPFERVRCMTHD